MTRALCLLWADSRAPQYLVTGLVHQLGSYWMHRAMLIDLYAGGTERKLFVWGQYQHITLELKLTCSQVHVGVNG